MQKNRYAHPVTMGNALIDARYNFTALEIEIFVRVVEAINGSNYSQITLSVQALVAAIDGGNASYEYVHQALKSLMAQPMTFYNEKLKQWTICNVISKAKIDKLRGQVVLTIDPFICEQIVNLKKEFTTFELTSILKLKSKYSKRIYLWVKKFMATGVLSLSLIEAKNRLLLSDKYPIFSDFKSRVIEPAILEINKESEINLSCRYIRSGKQTDEIIFSFSYKQNAAPINSHDAMSAFMARCRLAQWQIDNVFQVLTLPEIDFILVNFNRNKETVKNWGAYLAAVFSEKGVPMNRVLPRQLRIE